MTRPRTVLNPAVHSREANSLVTCWSQVRRPNHVLCCQAPIYVDLLLFVVSSPQWLQNAANRTFSNVLKRSIKQTSTQTETDRQTDRQTDKSEAELAEYKNIMTAPARAVEPLVFWQQKAERFPILSQTARRLLCVSATQPKRDFWSVGRTVTEMRWRLSADKVDSTPWSLCVQACVSAYCDCDIMRVSDYHYHFWTFKQLTMTGPGRVGSSKSDRVQLWGLVYVIICCTVRSIQTSERTCLQAPHGWM